MSKKVLIIVIVIITGIAGYFLVGSKFVKSYTSYAECVKDTNLPCKHYFVGDFGQEWRPSPYRSKEECDSVDRVVGSTCVIPPGNFRENRWIDAVDLERANREASQSSTLIPKDETANWKTYSNTQYEFEFKHPPDYSIRTETSNIFIEKQNGGLYAVVIIDNPSKLSASEYFEKFKSENKQQCEIGPCASILSSKAVQINNLQGVEVELAGEGSSDVRSIYFSVNNRIVNYQYGRDNLGTEFGGNKILYDTYISNGDKILSTFKLR